MQPPSESARKVGLELLLAAVVNGVFFALIALALWPFGKAGLAAQLAGGFCIFVAAGGAAAGVNAALQKLFRIESDPPSDAYVIVNLIVGAVVQLGWAAFVFMAVSYQNRGAAFWAAAAFYVIGLVSSWLATIVTGAFFQGSLYKRVNALLSMAGYCFFAVWPGAGRAFYGWFFAWL